MDIYLNLRSYPALAVMERLGLEESGGMVRVGGVHNNTLEEVSSLRDALVKLVDSQIHGLSTYMDFQLDKLDTPLPLRFIQVQKHQKVILKAYLLCNMGQSGSL